MDEKSEKIIEEKIDGLAGLISKVVGQLDKKIDHLDMKIERFERRRKDDQRDLSSKMDKIEYYHVQRIENLESDSHDVQRDVREIKEHVGMAD